MSVKQVNSDANVVQTFLVGIMAAQLKTSFIF